MIYRKPWARLRPEFGRGEVRQMKIRDYLCYGGNSLCCIKPYLSGRKLRSSPPLTTPSSLLGEGSRMSFIQFSWGIKAKSLHGWNWPQFAPLRTLHLSNIHNPIVLLTSPLPPPTVLHTCYFPSFYLIHLTWEISQRLQAINSTIYSLHMNATTYYP